MTTYRKLLEVLKTLDAEQLDQTVKVRLFIIIENGIELDEPRDIVVEYIVDQQFNQLKDQYYDQLNDQ